MAQAHAAAAEKRKFESSGATVAPRGTTATASTRSSRSRTSAVGSNTANVAPAARNSPSSSSAQDLEKDREVAEMQARVTAMQANYGAQLEYLVTEFTKLEAQLSREVGLAEVSP